MKARLKHKIFTNMYNPKMHYSINQILTATKGLFLTPIEMPNGYRYYMSHYCGKIMKTIRGKKNETLRSRRK